MENKVNDSFPFSDVLIIESDSSIKQGLFRKPLKIDNVILLQLRNHGGIKCQLLTLSPAEHTLFVYVIF